LRADPFEHAQDGSGMYTRWTADNMWIMVPAQGFVADFFGTLEGYPFQAGSSLSASNIGYQTIQVEQLKKMLDQAIKN
jgi:arylsulfatase